MGVRVPNKAIQRIVTRRPISMLRLQFEHKG